MCVHINSLPEECLLVTFDRIPLFDLLHLDQVCRRWAKLLPSACARRHTLVLILGGKRLEKMNFVIPFNDTLDVSFCCKPFYDLPKVESEASFTLPLLQLDPRDKFLSEDSESDDSEDDESEGFFDILFDTAVDCLPKDDFTEMARFQQANLSGQLVTYFADLFPNVDTLVVIHPQCDEHELNLLVDLVKSWSLVTLKLWLRIFGVDGPNIEGWVHIDRPNHHAARTLLESIEKQSLLQQLTLDIGGSGYFYSFTFPEKWYLFSEKFKVLKLYVGCYDYDSLIWNIVNQLDNEKLRHICFGNSVYSSKTLLDALNPKFQFATKVRHLYWNWCFETAELSEFCMRFTSLTMLDIYLPSNMTFTRFISTLASLTQLSYLKLTLAPSENQENMSALVIQNEDGEEVPVALPQLKNLELNIFRRAHHDDFQSLSSLVFPSLEVIILTDAHYQSIACTTCKPNINSCYIFERAKKCRQLLIFSLKNNFANAQVRIYARGYNESFVDWSNYVPTEDDLAEFGDDDVHEEVAP